MRGLIEETWSPDRNAASRSDPREAAVRGVKRNIAANPRDLRRIYADHRAVVARRGLSRRDRESSRHRLRDGDCRTDQDEDPRRDATDGVGWRLLQQVPRQ